MVEDQVISASILIKVHGYAPRTAQRVLAELRKKLGKDEKAHIFASEFIRENKIKRPSGYGEQQRGNRTEINEQNLEILKDSSIQRAAQLQLMVGCTYEVSYFVLGHYKKEQIGTFIGYTESTITAIFELMQTSRHEREVIVPVQYIEGKINPITVSARTLPVQDVDFYIRAITECKTIGIPTQSIVEVKVI